METTELHGLKFYQSSSEIDICNAFMQLPIAICMLKGKDYTIQFASNFYLQILDKEKSIIGQPLFKSFPELKNQGIKIFLDQLVESRKAKHVHEHKFFITRNKKREQRFFNCDCQPLIDTEGNVTGIISIFMEVTEQVLATNKTIGNQQKLTVALDVANIKLAFQIKEKVKTAAELGIAKKELAFQDNEKEKRAIELEIANIELAYQDGQKVKRANELSIANNQLVLQNNEKKKRAAELTIANKELAFQNDENGKRAAELSTANYARSLIEASLDPLFTISPEGKITDMNNASVNITGISRENLIGTDFFDYFTEPGMAREAYLQVFAKGFVADYPLTIRDSKLTDVLFNGSIYKDDQGHVMGVVIVARDVTAQKKIEKNLENSLKEISDYKYALDESSIVSITDQKGIIKYANANFCKISKYPCDELIGNDHRIINSGYHPKEFIAKLWATIANGKIWKGEIRNKAKDNTFYWVDTTIVPFLNEVGKPYQYIVIRTDITGQKRVEEELTDAKVIAELATTIAKEAQSNAESASETAKNAMQAKQQFLSNMSHEIRTPMNAIIGFTKVVLKTELSIKQKEYLNAIKMSGDALIVLINDILDLAKVDSGKMTFEQIPFKLATSISAMLHLFETKIQEKNLILIKDYDSKIPDILVGDPVRLHQIILNLVSNAVKFTTIGQITVTVRLINESDDKAYIEFAVKDTGIGISENKLENIFENFQQASSGISRIYGGTGLGLAIVKQLVEPQGGTIRVESKLGEGSTFSFVLGFEKTKSEAEFVREVIELDDELKGIKVLVVEDMALNQLLMKTLLEDFGFECDIAANGKIAIDKLQTKSYDIILMDLQMPEMDGFEATHYIRNNIKSTIPIIALTADVTTTDVAKCKTVGMNDYLAKPVDERILYSKILGLVKKSGMAIDEKLNPGRVIKPAKCTDLSLLNRRTKSNPALMTEMMQLYLEQTPPLIYTMKQSFQDNNWKLLNAAIHKIIPSFSIIGIHSDFEKIAKKIQQYANTQQLTDDISGMIFQIEQVCVQACSELEEEINRIKNAQ